MSKIIRQKESFAVPTENLYEMYMNTRIHSEIIRSPVIISATPGTVFMTFNGEIYGRTLHVVPGRLIVQSWRRARWKFGEPDSILVLDFSTGKKGGVIELTQINVPSRDYKAVSGDWKKYYWKPYRKYIREYTIRDARNLRRAGRKALRIPGIT